VPAASRDGAGGFVTVQYVWVIATSLLLFTLLANVVVVQYARGVVRTALDEGARAGARVVADPAAAERACEETAAAARRDLLGGRLGDGVAIDCLPGADVMRARASAAFPSWFPGVPDWHVTDEAVAVQEHAP
jgi:hypothetical protein